MPSVQLLIKPVSGSCNMRCRYCFYEDEAGMRETACYGKMTPETARTLIRKTLDAAEGSASFVFQGGEPTLAGLSFYRFFTDTVTEYNHKSLRVEFAIQTNGLLLSDEWCEFFAQNRFLVGLSLDGPRDIHNRNRRLTDGKGSFDRVMQSVELLKAHGCDFNILSVVTAHSDADKIYHFFRKNQLLYQQYVPFIPRLDGKKGEVFLSAQQYGKFLKRLFDLWYEDLAAGMEIHNRDFENWIGMLAGIPPEHCGLCGHCQTQYVVEADGSVYPCDFYVLDCFRCGNLTTDSFSQINDSIQSSGFAVPSFHVDSSCRTCPHYPVCRGGCRRYREPFLPNGLPGKSIFCASYLDFFSYASPRMRRLAASLTLS